jgi:transposase
MSQHQEQRRQQAMNKYLAADKVEDICRQLACSKSWLYKWRNRYDAPNAPWAQERSKRPKSHPTHTPEHVEQAVVALHRPWRHHGTASVAALRQALAQQGIEPVPSRRTLYRIVHRHHQKGK